MPKPIFVSQTKSIEWLMAFFMLGWAVTLVLPGNTMSTTYYNSFHAVGLDEAKLVTFYACVAVIRLSVLYLNGRIRKGPEVRLICSAVGAFTWLFTAALFAMPFFLGKGPLLVNATHHFIMFFAEIYAAGVAAFDRRIKL